MLGKRDPFWKKVDLKEGGKFFLYYSFIITFYKSRVLVNPDIWGAIF